MNIQLVTREQTISAKVIQLEGELLIVQVVPQDTNLFSVGDVITCMYHEHTYHSRVLRIYEDTVYLFFSIYKTGLENDGRRMPRVKVDLKGMAMSQNKISRKVFHVNQIKVIDISILGIGFLTAKELEPSALYTILPQADLLPIKADVVLRNTIKTEEGFRYGAEFTNITANHFQSLRTYVLTQQLLSGTKNEMN